MVTGGASVMEGMVELGEEVMGLPVRLGQPGRVGGLSDVVRSPKYSTAVGLVLYGAEQEVTREAERRDTSSSAGLAHGAVNSAVVPGNFLTRLDNEQGQTLCARKQHQGGEQ